MVRHRGCGDVLAGIIGSLMAAGITPARAAAVGARAHSLAANLAARGGGADLSAGRGTAPISAGTLLAHLRESIRVLRAGCHPEKCRPPREWQDRTYDAC